MSILERREKMTPVMQNLLSIFDRLNDSKRLDLGSEISKRTAYNDNCLSLLLLKWVKILILLAPKLSAGKVSV
jgi:hypothetical protein